jgi:hypothetical protein
MTGLAWMLVGLMISAAVRADRIEREWFLQALRQFRPQAARIMGPHTQST